MNSTNMAINDDLSPLECNSSNQLFNSNASSKLQSLTGLRRLEI